MDEPYLERPLDEFFHNERWSIVFTIKGRYYFVKYPERKSTWTPSSELLECLKDLPIEFFSPHYINNKVHQEEVKGEQKDIVISRKDFETLLEDQKEHLDPFSSWESIKRILKDDLRYQSVPEKEARRLFDAFCPRLLQLAKEKKERAKQNSLEKYQTYLNKLKNVPPTWTLMLRQIRLDESIRDILSVIEESLLKEIYEKQKL